MAAPAPLNWNALEPHLRRAVDLINANDVPMIPELQQIINRLDAFEARFDAYDARFDAFETRFDAFEARFDALEGRSDAVEARLTAIEARLGVVENRLGAIGGRLGVIEQRLGEIEAGQQQILTRLPMLIASANAHATMGSTLLYPLGLPDELLAELPRLKRDVLRISGEHVSHLLYILGIPVGPNATEQEQIAALCAWIGFDYHA